MGRIVFLHIERGARGVVRGALAGPGVLHDRPGNHDGEVVVVIDEAYQEFVRAEDAVDGIAMYRKYPNVVVLRTFSKAHGLAGLRVGYSVSNPLLTQHLRVAATPFAVSQIAEKLGYANQPPVFKALSQIRRRLVTS